MSAVKPADATAICAGDGWSEIVGETLIHGLHAVAAALNHAPEQVRGLWLERQRRDGRMQSCSIRRPGMVWRFSGPTGRNWTG